jgi:predicted ester cyclase
MTVVMTRADLEARVEHRAEATRRHDPMALARLHTEDGVVESPMFATLHGRQAIEESYRALFSAFPDLEGTTDAVVVDPPRVALFTTFHATHVGEIFGMPGTRRRIHFTVAQLLSFEDDLIAHDRRIYDFTGVLLQVGILRAKPARP